MVARYDFCHLGSGECSVMDDGDGSFVHYDDYAKLESDHKSAMLTLDKIVELLGTSDKLSISEQVAALQLQVVNLAVENSTIKTMNDCLSEELRGYKSDGAFYGPDMHKLWYSHAGAIPETSIMLANIHAQGVDEFLNKIEWIIRAECNPDKTESIISGLKGFAAQLRKGEKK